MLGTPKNKLDAITIAVATNVTNTIVKKTAPIWEDVFQEVYFAAWKAQSTFKPGKGANIRTWMNLKGRGAGIDFLREWNKTRRSGFVATPLSLDAIISDEGDEDGFSYGKHLTYEEDFYEDFVDQSAYEWALENINLAPQERYRILQEDLLKAMYEEETQKGAADRLGMTEGAICHKLTALRKLNKAFLGDIFIE